MLNREQQRKISTHCIVDVKLDHNVSNITSSNLFHSHYIMLSSNSLSRSRILLSELLAVLKNLLFVWTAVYFLLMLHYISYYTLPNIQMLLFCITTIHKYLIWIPTYLLVISILNHVMFIDMYPFTYLLCLYLVLVYRAGLKVAFMYTF